MIINGNINNDNEDKEADDMLALLRAIRDYQSVVGMPLLFKHEG